MESTINFLFRAHQYFAIFTICKRASPTYIYVTLTDELLIKEFGEEFVMHAAEGALLVDHIFTSHRYELYKAIFTAIAAVEELFDDRLTSRHIQE